MSLVLVLPRRLIRDMPAMQTTQYSQMNSIQFSFTKRKKAHTLENWLPCWLNLVATSNESITEDTAYAESSCFGHFSLTFPQRTPQGLHVHIWWGAEGGWAAAWQSTGETRSIIYVNDADTGWPFIPLVTGTISFPFSSSSRSRLNFSETLSFRIIAKTLRWRRKQSEWEDQSAQLCV